MGFGEFFWYEVAMNEMLNVVVDGLWRQGDRSLAVRLVSASGEPLPGGRPAPILMSICPAG
jgi:vanillate O-demethylase ferredoxin subunit